MARQGMAMLRKQCLVMRGQSQVCFARQWQRNAMRSSGIAWICVVKA